MNIVEDFLEPYGEKSTEITTAVYSGNYCITITFSDGESKQINFRPFLEKSMHPSVRKYIDENLLKSFSIINGNLNWNDYELIFPIDDLYNNRI